MRVYSLDHLSDSALLRDLDDHASGERTATAAFLARIAEVDARRLYVHAGYPSMHAYCVEKLRLSEDAAYKRIQAARAARRFPGIFEAVADGHVHLAGVCLIAPHLTPDNVTELLELATHKRKSEIEVALARRLSRPRDPQGATASVRPIPSGVGPESDSSQVQLRSEVAQFELAPGQVESALQSEESYLLQVRLNAEEHALLRYAQDLLSHAVPSGDLACVLVRALRTLVAELEKRKFAAARRVRPVPQVRQVRQVANDATTSAGRPRHIPAYVKRAVWRRDGMRCTFENERGQRCSARRFLELDHVDPVARGGRASIEGLRVRCRAHNQMEAEQAFGAEFMDAKREAARAARAARDQAAAAAVHDRDVLLGLRGLGVRLGEARLALAEIPRHDQASLEERIGAALRWVGRSAFLASRARGERMLLAAAAVP
jgi:hypothetical protein